MMAGDGVHCVAPCTPENLCFGHKLKYWREVGTPIQFSYGRADFHGPSVASREKQAIADARAGGIEPERR